MEFRLREYRPEDLELLWRIDQNCFAPGIAYSRRELGAYIRRQGAFTLVAEQAPPCGSLSPSIAGFIVAEARRGQGHILTIDVLPGSRRFGLGSKLLLTAEDRLRGLSCDVVVLETAVDNAAALTFYKRHQYTVARVVPHYYQSGVDALLLAKDLSPGVRTATR